MYDDAKALLDKPITRQKLEAFLEKYYDIDDVTKEFWTAFTGQGKDAVLNGDRLKYCLTQFERYRKWTGHTLKYMAENSKVYVVPARGLANWVKMSAGGIDGLLKTAKNPEVKRTWESAKYLTQDNGTDGHYSDETYQWFSTMLALGFADKLADEKLNKKPHEVSDLDLKNGLVVELYNKYIERWMLGDEKSGQTELGISPAEWKGLEAKQKAIKNIGEDYFGDALALSDLKLPNERAEKRLDEAILRYQEGNKTAVMQLIGQLRQPYRAGPSFLL